jgi:hypothetical protein
MLKLRRGIVSRADPLHVRVGGDERPAWADQAMVGEIREGDEVIVNTEALDLDLGSGGFDVVHVNLTRGLEAEGTRSATAMKLNYTSLQHPVEPVEAWSPGRGEGAAELRTIPVLVLGLHGQLAPAAWAAHRPGRDLRIGYVQTWGGALPGGLSQAVKQLRSAGLLCSHVTSGPTYGGDLEALTTVGALWAAAGPLAWDAAIVGPGPGIGGSGSALGHGGMAALESAHAASSLGLDTLLAARMSERDPRDRHRGLSHHTAAVLHMLLSDVRVAAPAEAPLDDLRRACEGRHELWIREAPVEAYAASGLPADHMGRGIDEDELFFAAALAAGDGLAALAIRERVG